MVKKKNYHNKASNVVVYIKWELELTRINATLLRKKLCLC